ncbi:uncharacterized protein [Montipora foliosa]|uniref:uncharacterized protein isoform X2 n=1 Tax=Montipora foliosa TaxID=591990 RepID=UPI0035F1403B
MQLSRYFYHIFLAYVWLSVEVPHLCRSAVVASDKKKDSQQYRTALNQCLQKCSGDIKAPISMINNTEGQQPCYHECLRKIGSLHLTRNQQVKSESKRMKRDQDIWANVMQPGDIRGTKCGDSLYTKDAVNYAHILINFLPCRHGSKTFNAKVSWIPQPEITSKWTGYKVVYSFKNIGEKTWSPYFCRDVVGKNIMSTYVTIPNEGHQPAAQIWVAVTSLPHTHWDSKAKEASRYLKGCKQEIQPGPPTNVVALPSSSSSINLSWSAPRGNFEIYAYVVYCNRIGDGEAPTNVLNATEHIHVIKELHGFTNYTLYVRAVTKALLGRKSRSVVQRTLEGKPSRAPKSVSITSITPDSLDLEWQPPPIMYQNGIITKYIIEWEEHGKIGSPSSLEVPGHILHTTINGLFEGKTYSVKVSAATVIGRGIWSPPVIGTVLTQPDNGFKFDAFIIYSTVDQKWVTKKLLPTLESKHKIKCCIHYRDFVPGVPFTQNMADSVYNSKKTVAVVSKSFLNSNFCSHELSIALHRLAERGDNSVVVIKLDDVKNSQLPKELRFRSYIDFTKSTDKRTWEFKLVNGLKA